MYRIAMVYCMYSTSMFLASVCLVPFNDNSTNVCNDLYTQHIVFGFLSLGLSILAGSVLYHAKQFSQGQLVNDELCYLIVSEASIFVTVVLSLILVAKRDDINQCMPEWNRQMQTFVEIWFYVVIVYCSARGLSVLISWI